MGVPTNDDGFDPARHQAWDILAYDSFAEDGAAQDISDGSVRGAPHLLKVKLLNALLVRRDGGALDAHAVATHRLCSVHGHLVVSGIAVLDAQVIAAMKNKCHGEYDNRALSEGKANIQA